MLGSVAVALIIILVGALVWTFHNQLALRRQLAGKAQELAQLQQMAEAAKKDYEAKLATAVDQGRAAEESIKRLNLLRKVASDVLYDLDVVSGVLQWSDALFAAYGYERSEPAGTVEWWTDHVHPDDAMKLNDVMDRLNDPTASEWEVDYRFRKADESYVWVHDRSLILRNDRNEPIHLIGSLHDVSAEKQTA